MRNIFIALLFSTAFAACQNSGSVNDTNSVKAETTDSLKQMKEAEQKVLEEEMDAVEDILNVL